MGRSDDHGFLSDAVIVIVYAAGVILWAAQPHWLTRQSLLSGFAVTLGISAEAVRTRSIGSSSNGSMPARYCSTPATGRPSSR